MHTSLQLSCIAVQVMCRRCTTVVHTHSCNTVIYAACAAGCLCPYCVTAAGALCCTTSMPAHTALRSLAQLLVIQTAHALPQQQECAAQKHQLLTQDQLPVTHSRNQVAGVYASGRRCIQPGSSCGDALTGSPLNVWLLNLTVWWIPTISACQDASTSTH